MDRLTAMKVFAEIARSGSFTASADRLGMSRAMVTRHVALLEQWLDVRLLQRTTRRVTLTDAGEQCLRRVLQILELSQQVEEDVVSGDGALRGQLRLTSSMSFAHSHLAEAIAAFLRLHPRLKIDLDASDRAVNLVEARIDLAIRITADPDPGLVARLLAECDSVLVAAPAYLRTHGAPAHPTELPGHDCLGYTNFGRSVWSLTRAGESGESGATEQVRVNTRFTANEATVLLRAAIAGAGIAVQPTYLANARIASGELQRVLPEWAPRKLGIYALYVSRRHLSPAVRALLDFLAARFARVNW